MRAPLLLIIAGVLVALLAALGAWFLLGQGGAPDAQENENGLITLRLGETGSVGAVSITPQAVVEDSRCPADVQCIQAGTVRVRSVLISGLGTATPVFLLGEPVTTEAEAVTLIEVRPAPVSTAAIANADYRFTFKVENRGLTYINASSDRIQVDLPYPGAVTGKQFSIIGEARGNWFFEASFPIDVLDRNGGTLTTVVAQAQGEWMTAEFVPFRAEVSIPESYSGPATLVLRRDNASGLPEHDASVSFPITIEY